MFVRDVDFQQWLLACLNNVTPPEVLQMDANFYAAKDKDKFRREQDPLIKSKWMQYCWIRREATYLANQKIQMDGIENYLKLAGENIRPDLFPPVENSIEDVIKSSKQNGMNFTDSINILKQICLQVVGTEHPTDPLSQTARTRLTELAVAISTHSPDTESIENIFHELLHADAIPKQCRSVVEEVGRDVRMTLNQLYDGLFALIDAILAAYEKSYPQEFITHQDDIWKALENIVRDATWTAGDADNNNNVTPNEMANGMRIRRIRIAEKHMVMLNTKIIDHIKEEERACRDQCWILHDSLYNYVLENASNKEALKSFYTFQSESKKFISNRCIHALINFYAKNTPDCSSFTKIQKETINSYLADLQKQAVTMKNLTALSGTSYISKSGDLAPSALQEFLAIFARFKADIQLNTNEIDVASEIEGMPSINISEHIINKFNVIMRDHAAILAQFPKIKHLMRSFGIQLHCYGMSYGEAHVRQDSSVYVNIWNSIIKDLAQEPHFKDYAIFALLKGNTYKESSVEVRTQFHLQLQNKTRESIALLAEIYRRKEAQIYLTSEKYQTKEFELVRQELERMELAIRHKDMFSNSIISNAESFADILAVKSLKNIFPTDSSHLAIVPLLEKREDLEHAPTILDQYIKLLILETLDNPEDQKRFIDENTRTAFIEENRDKLAKIIVEVMFGYSDTERVSGTPALISVEQAQEDFRALAKQYGVTPKLFHGQGGDPFRGGLHKILTKGTWQGVARNLTFATPALAHQFREKQFAKTFLDLANAQMEFANLPAKLLSALKVFCKDGTQFYERVHNTQNGLGNLVGLLYGMGPAWIVTILNSSSRADRRGGKQNHSDRTASVQEGGNHPEKYIQPDGLRAITETQINEILRTYFHMLIGPGRALRSMNEGQIKSLYALSPTFKDIYLKMSYAIAMTDFSIAKKAYFGEDSKYLYQDEATRKQWASEIETQTFSEAEIREKLKTPQGMAKLMHLLAQLFALMEEEYHATAKQIFALNKVLHREFYCRDQDTVFVKGTDLIKHFPEWHAQVEQVLKDIWPVSEEMAAMNKHIADGGKIDRLYPTLNHPENIHPNSELSGVAAMIGAVGAAITASRYMLFPPVAVQKLATTAQVRALEEFAVINASKVYRFK